MGVYIEIESLACNPAQVAAGDSAGVDFIARNIGDEEATRVPVTVTVNGPDGSTLTTDTSDYGPIAAGAHVFAGHLVGATHFNQSGSYTAHVSTPGGGSGSCSFTVG